MECEMHACPYANALNAISKNFGTIATNFNEINMMVINLAKRSLSVNEYEAFYKEITERHDRLTEKQFNRKR